MPQGWGKGANETDEERKDKLVRMLEFLIWAMVTRDYTHIKIHQSVH